jgi:hypothetical protein
VPLLGAAWRDGAPATGDERRRVPGARRGGEDGPGHGPFGFAYTFYDTELDLGAVAAWWQGQKGRADPDIFKNNTVGWVSRTTFSAVARLLKQGGAEEVLKVHSPKLLSWGKGALVQYLNDLIAAAAARRKGAGLGGPALALVADRTAAKR